MVEVFRVDTCPICGKSFVYNPQSIYWTYVNIGKGKKKKYNVCSYTCFKIVTKGKPAIKWEKKRT